MFLIYNRVKWMIKRSGLIKTTLLETIYLHKKMGIILQKPCENLFISFEGEINK